MKKYERNMREKYAENMKSGGGRGLEIFPSSKASENMKKYDEI